MNIDQDQVPATLDDAVRAIIAGLTEDEKTWMRNQPPARCVALRVNGAPPRLCKIGGSIVAHHTVGRHLRNEWSLWEPACPMRLWFASTLGISHPDDVSGTILEAVWCAVRGEPFDAKAHVQTYIDHWREQGLNPVTGGVPLEVS